MKKLILISLLFSACTQKVESVPKPVEYTELQKEYLKQASIAKKVFLEACLAKLDSSSYGWQNCIVQAERLGWPEQVQQNNGPSVGEIAVGSALGAGMVRILTK